MKRHPIILLLPAVILLSCCAPRTVSSGGVVIRGSATPAPIVDYFALAEKENLVFITESGTKYHLSGCSFVSDPPIALTLKQAQEEGYTPCSRCHPD